MPMMKPKVVVLEWIGAFDRADADALAALYVANAVNHQVAKARSKAGWPFAPC
jgi:hypothetical protein